jgi:hypothetical protein
MANIINIKKRIKALERCELSEVCEDEQEEIIHQAFMRRQDLCWKRPILDEEISAIDCWLLQQEKLPLDICISIWSRITFCEWLLYDDLNPEQKHIFLLHLRNCYRQFQKLPQRYQDALFSIGYGRWAAEFADEEEEAKRGTA